MSRATCDPSNFYNERRYEKAYVGKLFVVFHREADTRSRAFAKARLRAGKLIADNATERRATTKPATNPTQGEKASGRILREKTATSLQAAGKARRATEGNQAIRWAFPRVCNKSRHKTDDCDKSNE